MPFKQNPDAKLLTELMAVASEGVVLVDANGTILRFSAGAEQIFGWAAADVVGAPLDMLIPERFRHAHAEHLDRFLDDAPGARCMGERGEIVGQHRNGNEIPAMASVSRTTMDGEPVLIAVVRDLSVRKARERQLEKSEQRFRAMFDLSYQFAGLLSPDGRLMEANQTSLAFLGAKIEDLRGQAFLDTPWFARDPDAHARVDAALRRAQGGASAHGRIRLTHPADGVRIFDFSIRPALGADGEVQYLIAEGTDVTRTALATEALQQSEQRLRQAQRIASMGYWHWDIATGRLDWSDEVYEIFGYSSQRPQPTYGAFLGAVHPEDRSAVIHAIQAALSGQRSYCIDHRILRPDGAVRTVHEQAELTRDASGTAISMTGIVQDITERKETEHALVDAHRRAERANAAKSQFLAIMSHELRTPLNAINGFSEMLVSEIRGPLGVPVYRDYADHILNSGKHLLDLIDRILDATRIEAGNLRIAEDWFPAAGLVEMIRDAVRSEAEQKRVEVRIGEVCPAALCGDRRLLRQALLNLIRNAIKFFPDGGRVRLHATHRADGHYAFDVRDHGPGIPADQLRRVTLPFVQADDRLERAHGGSGLGLYLSKSFVELHGGGLELSCPADGGTLASVLLPPARVADEDGRLEAGAREHPNVHAGREASACNRTSQPPCEPATTTPTRPYYAARGTP